MTVVDWQEKLAGWPAGRAMKEQSYRALPPDGLVLDVGCGPGIDLVGLGPRRAVGVDATEMMCRLAQKRGGTVVLADASTLPFGDESFSGVRADKVVQHLADPATAISEMIRVTRHAGRIVTIDPDQETLTIHVPGAPGDVVEEIKRLRRDVAYRNGHVAVSLPALFVELGLTDVDVTAFPVVVTDPDEGFNVARLPRLWREQGVGHFDPRAVDAWETAIDRARRNGGFVLGLTYFLVHGTRP